jgi:glycosyltransferase involved in cell wall biosynthesis
MRHAKWIVMLGTDMRSPGGMTAVVASYREAGLFAQWPLLFLPTFHRKTTADRLWMALQALLRFLWLLLRGRVLAVHAHVASRASFWRKSIFLMLAHAAGKPALFHLHDGEFAQWYAQRLGPLAQGLVRLVLRRVDRVIVLAPVWAEAVRAIEPAARIVELPNPVQIPAQPAEPRPGRVLFMARLWPEKGIEELLQAAAALLPRVPQLELVLAGDGDEAGVTARAQALGLGGHVRLTGWIAGEAKQRELMQAAVFVLPSWFEGMPIGVLEAMAAGVPVVASEVGGIGAALGPQAGLLVPVRDVAALSEALATVLQDAALARRMGEAGRRRAIERFAAPRVVQALGEIYASLGLQGNAAADGSGRADALRR